MTERLIEFQAAIAELDLCKYSEKELKKWEKGWHDYVGLKKDRPPLPPKVP